MDVRLDKIENKVDRLDTRLDDITNVLVKQEVNLQEHMRRSLKNEEAVDILKTEVHGLHVYRIRVDFAFKILAFIGGIIAVIASLKQIFS